MILEQNRYLDELKMEVDGAQYSSTAPDNKQTSKVKEAGEKSDPDIHQVVQDHANMSKVVMSRNKRKLYEAMEVNASMMPFLLFSGGKRVHVSDVVKLPWIIMR